MLEGPREGEVEDEKEEEEEQYGAEEEEQEEEEGERTSWVRSRHI